MSKQSNDKTKDTTNETKVDDIKPVSEIGLFGLAVMGQNLALNIAEKGFKISVCNRSPGKVDTTVERAKKELGNNKDNLIGFKNKKDFVLSLKKPRSIIILVKAGKPVEAVINDLMELLDPNDLIIDGGNEWYENTEERAKKVATKKLLYMGMGVSGGEDGARYGPSLMPGGDLVGYKRVQNILTKVAAKTKDGTICVTYIGPRGAGNYVKMVHNGIEYGDMQLIAEAYDIMKSIGGFSNKEIGDVFTEWNKGDLKSYLIEITSIIFKKKDDRGKNKDDYLVDKVLDKTGQKGTGMWTVRDSCIQAVAIPTIGAALNARFLSSYKSERTEFEKFIDISNDDKKADNSNINKKEFIEDIKKTLYASKICSYTQGMNLIKTVGEKNDWNLDLGKIASIWKGGCIIRAQFLDRITAAYKKNAKLKSLLFDPEFAKDVKTSIKSWRKIISLAVLNGIAVPAMSGSLAYFDSYRRSRLPANLTQAQRDFFGAHTYQRSDYKDIDDCKDDKQEFGKFIHSQWNKL